MPLEELDRHVVEGERGRDGCGGGGQEGENKEDCGISADVSDSALSSAESHGEGGQRQGQYREIIRLFRRKKKLSERGRSRRARRVEAAEPRPPNA